MTMDPIRIEDYEDEEEDFLREVAAAEAEAASAKSPGFAPQTRSSTVEGVYTAALRGSRSELWQQNPLNLKSQGHTVKVVPNATVTAAAGYFGSETSNQEIAEKDCPCGKGVCSILTSNTQKNPGRKFYKCPVREENGGCGFFNWCDEDKPPGANVSSLSYGNTNENKFPELQCPCGAGPCRVLTAKTGQNIGQQFYRCPTFEGSCGFFKWCNDQRVTSTTQYDFDKSSIAVDLDNKSLSSARPGSACFNLRSQEHAAKVVPTATVTPAAGSFGSETSNQEIAEKDCPCGKGVCSILTSNSQKNPGRKFYKCPVREENGGCGFFNWCDDDKPPGANASALSSGVTNERKFPELQCPCGAGPCRVLTAKTGQNIGQQFYRCPTFEGSCSFFKWCNDQRVTSTTQYDFNKSSIVVDSDNKSFSSSRMASACFKCGKEGHWARDCPTSSDHSQYLSKPGSGTTSSSAGDCFKCGKLGHWARDCSSGDSTNMPFKRQRQY